MKRKISLLMAIFTATTSIAGTELTKAPVITKPLPEPPPPCEEPTDGEALYCPDNEYIHVEYLNSTNKTANRIVNTAINEYISPELAARTDSADGIPNDSDYYPAIDQYIRDNSTSYSAANINLAIGQQPTYCGLEQYDVSINFYSGGASTGSQSWLFVFNGDQQITTDMLIIPEKRSEIERLIEDALFRYLLAEQPDSDDPDFGYPRLGWEDLSPYFNLASDGLHLQYQAYDILPGIYGDPELVLPWQWLDSIVEPHFLPEKCQ
ncbi:RsiV family protein [Cardiobacteriaceae bacterium TAE3-ERU3]|nr:RsiV family protein [Cardiobacteriaceae bacterium TAE3-ERU3]